MLAPARAKIERGEAPRGRHDVVGRALFWKDKALVARMLSKWSAENLAKVADGPAGLSATYVQRRARAKPWAKSCSRSRARRETRAQIGSPLRRWQIMSSWSRLE